MKKYIIIATLLCFRLYAFAQVKTTDISELKPEETYSNIKVVPLHSDSNSSVYMIYIKQAVKKHVHRLHTEVVTVVDGRGSMYLAGETFDIKKGDHIVIPPNTPHAVVTTSKKPLQVLSVQSPQFLGKDRHFIE